MDYPFENLDPEKFQQFCQALLTKEFSNVQCFPVAQPDGGRDSISYVDVNFSDKFIVYQVKFVRKPQAESEPHKWLIGILKDEAPKIKQQIPKGAEQFVLMTNIAGTAHPEVGSIDKTQEILDRYMDVPSMCWWRDDLNRRLDNAWDLKWIYPELMTGTDFIRAIFETRLSEDQQRRSNTIKALIQDQFATDQLVKFKQIELQNRLLDLFIDVPVSLSNSDFLEDKKKKKSHSSRSTFYQIRKDVAHSNSQLINESSDKQIGAATLLLHPLIQNNIPCIVLEGAPGQGKSTITQYICQVHRMRLLNQEDLSKTIPKEYRQTETVQKLPQNHKNSAVKLPFRIDLRDFAKWLSKKNPFNIDNDEVPENWEKSLESFLAALIKHRSGGCEFSVTDLLAIAKISPVLLVFDGLDEVADISRRREVVDEISRGIRRLKVNTESLQVIVTSRPSAFANSPGLQDDDFTYFQLESLTNPLIFDYTDKWLKARKLSPNESKEVKQILKEKLEQPHLRDLTRNPMQLAILLSLIYTRGSSLPDKRTSLYDNYVDLYFNRESEKSSVVRENRDLLINISRYLAWVLHSEAEKEGSSGSITADRLHILLNNYLRNNGHEESLEEKLFTGMIERVSALVSRVQGIYEFEVQPLREYFAARHLYETAAYSPTGKETNGTLPDRFDAIAKNFYWLNVTRFYAGCYSKGELPSLIDRLEDLINSDGYNLISHPRILAATLLSDWVFSQHPKSVQAVIKLILDGIGLRYILPSNSRRVGNNAPMILPQDCGKSELIKHCFAILSDSLPKDYALDVIDLIKANASSQEIYDFWFGAIVSHKGKSRTQWFEYGYHLGILHNISDNDLNTIFNDNEDRDERLCILFKARKLEYFSSDEQRFNCIVHAVLDKKITILERSRTQSILDKLSSLLNPQLYIFVFHESRHTPLSEFWSRGFYENYNYRRLVIDNLRENSVEDRLNFSEFDKIKEFVDVVQEQSQIYTVDWATQIKPWDNIVEKGRELWGEKWSLFVLANISAAIKSATEKYQEFDNLLDHNQSLCKRTRNARLKSGAFHWWTQQFDQLDKINNDNELELMFILLVFITWASSKSISKILNKIDSLISQLSETSWFNLFNALQEDILIVDQSNNRLINLETTSLPPTLNPRTVIILSLRTQYKLREKLYNKYLKDYDGYDLKVLQFCQQIALELLSKDSSQWNTVHTIIQKTYSKSAISEKYAFHKFLRSSKISLLPDNIAEEIAKNPDCYPSFLVAAAEIKCTNIVAQKIVPVGKIAEEENWFKD